MAFLHLINHAKNERIGVRLPCLLLILVSKHIIHPNTSMKDNFEAYYTQMPELISKLNSDLKPQFGTMDVLEMVEHLTIGLELSMSYKEYFVKTPKEQIPAFQRWLMTDKPFRPGSPMPKNFENFQAPDGQNLEAAKKRFIEKLRLFIETVDEDDKFWSVHESFGKLDAEQTRQLHFKHITHHLTQFGVIS